MQQKATDSVATGDVAGAQILPFGQELGGRYEIREVLGVGGYAVVYRAYDRELKAEIALKVLRHDRSSPAAITRFRREANVARDAASPHLLRIFDITAGAEGCFLTMELVRGESLRQRLARGRLEIEEAVGFTIQILEGLRALHAKNIVHRDLKPENVLIDEDGTVKIADFGLAYFLDSEHSRATAAGAIVGTTDYISPEQALEREVDSRADLYTTGILLFEMLTGSLPFPRDSSFGAVLARLRTPPPPVRSLRPDVPLWLSAIVSRLMEKDRAARYPTAKQVIDALNARRFDIRSVLRPRRVVMLAAAAAVITAGLVVPRTHSRPEFARLERRGNHGIAAVSQTGQILWQRANLDPDIASTYALARIERGGKPLIAAILGAPGDFSVKRMETLSFLDPLTGEVIRRVHLPSAASSFPHDPARFLVRSIVACDLDGDGIDEIIATFQHLPEAPSYVVLYEPRLDRVRFVFIGYGNHDFAGVHDVDGDGKPEILILGINNGFDWFNALAAVRISPWLNDTKVAEHMPSSPDFGMGASDASLLWYTLLPRGWLPRYTPWTLSFDDLHRRITVRMQTGRTIRVSYDGFLDKSPTPPAQRQESRRAAYAHYRESQRLFDAGFSNECLGEAERAVQSATAASDPILTEAMQRSLGKLLIRTGQVGRGVQLLETLYAHSENASEIAFDAAVALHLHGDVARAVEWYRRGAGKGASLDVGKSKHEFLQGIVLGLTELGRGREALADYERFRQAYSWGPSGPTALYVQFIRWRNGERPSLEGIDIPWNATDLTRYWVLEFRNTNGEPPEPLLNEVNDLIAVGDDPQCVLWSLKGELLWRLGRKAEAIDAVSRANAILSTERTRSVVARAHAPVIAERYARIAKGRV